jgi:hypothetical protein
MSTRKWIILNGLAASAASLFFSLLFLINRGIWLVGVSTVIEDLQGAPDNIARLILLIGSVHWAFLLVPAIVFTGFWFWKTYKTFSTLGLATEQIARIDGVRQQIDALENRIPQLVTQGANRSFAGQEYAQLYNYREIVQNAYGDLRTLVMLIRQIEKNALPKLLSDSAQDRRDGDMETVFLGGNLDGNYQTLSERMNVMGELKLEAKPAPYPIEQMRAAETPAAKHSAISGWLQLMRTNLADYEVELRAEVGLIKRRTTLGSLLPPPPDIEEEIRR